MQATIRRTICAFLFAFAGHATAQGNAVFVNEVFTGGAAAVCPPWVEIHNAGVATVDLTGWQIFQASASSTNTAPQSIASLSGVIAPGEYLLAAVPGFCGAVAADWPLTGTLGVAGGKVILARSASVTIDVNGCAFGAGLVDWLGYGAANCAEGFSVVTPPPPAPSSTQSLMRLGCDSDNNNSDFAIVVGPTPRAKGLSNCILNSVPGEPRNLVATRGDARATFTFDPPLLDGFNPIVAYTVTCQPGSVTGGAAASPITVTGLTNNVAYSCTVSATNLIGPGAPSAPASVTPVPTALLAVLSRKTHAAAGDFDLAIDPVPAIGGAISVEPRTIGAGHTIIFQFNVPVFAVGTVAAVDAAAANVGSAASVALGSDVVVTFTGVPDNQRASVSLTGVNGALDASASMGFLVGDVNGSRAVTATDIVQVKSRSGQAADATTFKFDLNASGSITATDILQTKGRAGLVLP